MPRRPTGDGSRRELQRGETRRPHASGVVQREEASPGADEVWDKLRQGDVDETLRVVRWNDHRDLQEKLSHPSWSRSSA